MAYREETGLTPDEAREVSERMARIDSRDPSDFKRMLAIAIGCEPTRAALQAFANKAPDRYTQYLILAAKLAGFHTDKLEIQGSGLIAFARGLERMSDAELEAEYQRRSKPPAKVIDLPHRPDVPAEGGRP